MVENLLIYMPILMISLVNVANGALAKKFQKNVGMNIDVFIIFNIYNSIIACVYFFCADSFRIYMNITTMLFSVIYAVAVGINHLLTFLAYSKTTLSFVSVVSTSGTIILSTLFGKVYLKEEISFCSLASLILLVLAVVIPAVDLVKNKEESRKNSVSVLIGFFVISGIIVIISKLYSGAEDVCSSNSFFFMTNVILFFGAVILFFIKTRCSLREGKRLLKIFSFRDLANIGTRNIISNIAAFITIAVLKYTDIGVYSVLTYSMVLIISLFVSKFLFKEEIKIKNIISVALAVLAIIINPV